MSTTFLICVNHDRECFVSLSDDFYNLTYFHYRKVEDATCHTR
jgi:hypothetical protein